MGLYLKIKTKDCVGCHACEVACKQQHDLPVGADRIRILERIPRFEALYCRHCVRPPCKDACPTEAIYQERGVVLLDKERCIGCRACVEACPFGAVGFDLDQGLAIKCDLCYEHRLSKGLGPACASVCPARCIEWGELREAFKRPW